MSIKTIHCIRRRPAGAHRNRFSGPYKRRQFPIIAPPTSIEQAHYYRHHGWRHGMRYGWYGHRHYGYGYPGYHWGYAGAMPAVGVISEPPPEIIARTPVRTCLYEPGVLATGCSCKVPGGRARGTVDKVATANDTEPREIATGTRPVAICR